jgi:anti-sigma factor RsiW
MSPEQLEFNLSQYLDGTLPPEHLAALEAALATDPRARSLRDEHERLTSLLRARPLPEMDWDELARDFSAVVTGSVDEASRAEDQRLNAVLRGLPAVPAMDWDHVTRQISGAVEAEITRVDAEDERVETLLRSAPLPNLDWDRLAERISKGIDAEKASAPVVAVKPAKAAPAREQERPAVAGRIGFVRTFSRFAIAACVLVATGLGIRMYNKPVATPVTPGNPGGPTVVVVQTVIETPTVEVAKSPAVAEISIGPSKAYAENTDADLYRRGIGSNRSQVVIATPAPPADDDGSDHSLGIE